MAEMDTSLRAMGKLGLQLERMLADLVSELIAAARSVELDVDRPLSPMPGGGGRASPYGTGEPAVFARPGGRFANYREVRREMLLRFDADYVSELLAAAGNNVSLAARMAGIDRKHLWRLIRRTHDRRMRASRGR